MASSDRDRPPLAVWPCGQSPYGPSYDLDHRLLTEFTSEGGHLVAIGDRDGAVRSIAHGLGRTATGFESVHTLARRLHPRHTPARPGAGDHLDDDRNTSTGHHSLARTADLVLGPLPDFRTRHPAAGRGDERHATGYERDITDLVCTISEVLKPGGMAALVRAGACRSGSALDPVMCAARAAHEAGLVYLQHIIALTGRPDGVVPPPAPSTGGETGQTVVVPAHDDVIVLARPNAETEAGR